ACRIESAAGMTDVDKVIPLEHSQNERAERLPRAVRLGEAADHGFLLLARLDLEPKRAAPALVVMAGGVLGDDAFQMLLGRRVVKGDAVLLDVLAQPNHRIRANQRLQQLLAARQGELAQVLAVEIQKIEYVI